MIDEPYLMLCFVFIHIYESLKHPLLSDNMNPIFIHFIKFFKRDSNPRSWQSWSSIKNMGRDRVWMFGHYFLQNKKLHEITFIVFSNFFSNYYFSIVIGCPQDLNQCVRVERPWGRLYSISFVCTISEKIWLNIQHLKVS